MFYLIFSRRESLSFKMTDDTQNDARTRVEIEKEKIELRETINSWRVLQDTFMPDIISIATSQTGPFPEMDALYLPSQVPIEYQSCPWYPSLAKIELELSKGQAADALDNLRDALQLEELLLVGKAKAASGNMSVTRAQGYVNRASAHVQHFKGAYDACRLSMIKLGLKDDDAVFPKLTAGDIRVKAVTGWKATGEGKVTDSWIWTHGIQGRDTPEWKDDSKFSVILE